MSLKIKDNKDTFTQTKAKNSLLMDIPTLQKLLKKFLQTEGKWYQMEIQI